MLEAKNFKKRWKWASLDNYFFDDASSKIIQYIQMVNVNLKM